jgi:four helix bundle protein
MNEELKATFETLEVWQESRKLRMEVSQIVKDFPDEEKYRLVDQMIRAARSVSGNIAEGHGRNHFQENIQFGRRARGSLAELLDHLYVALDEKYISEEKFNHLRNKSLLLVTMVNTHIEDLAKQKHAHSASAQTAHSGHTAHSPHHPQPNKTPGGKGGKPDGAKRV